MSKISSQSHPPVDLWYPSLIVSLLSSAGQELFSKSSHIAYDRLNLHFEPQEHLSFCGVACASILLKTLLPYQNWTQSSLYSNIARNYMWNGLTLANLSNILKICGLQSIIRYCHDENIEEQFRIDLKQENQFLVVNYWRQFQDKNRHYIHRSGHFSLIAGYNQTTDHVLIMDTNSTIFPHHWLPLKDLIRMMSTYDRTASMQRGYLIIKQIENNHSILIGE